MGLSVCGGKALICVRGIFVLAFAGFRASGEGRIVQKTAKNPELADLLS